MSVVVAEGASLLAAVAKQPITQTPPLPTGTAAAVPGTEAAESAAVVKASIPAAAKKTAEVATTIITEVTHHHMMDRYNNMHSIQPTTQVLVL